MLIITSETQPATASIQGFFARGYRHGQPQPGCARAKAIVDEIHVTSEPDSRLAVLRLDGTLQTPIDGVLRSTVVFDESSSICQVSAASTRPASASWFTSVPPLRVPAGWCKSSE